MMEICTHGIRHAIAKTKQLSSSSTGIFLYSLATGTVGIIILLAFCSMLLSSTALSFILPAIIGFNGAAAGYGYANKKWTDFPLQKLPLSIIAVLLAIVGCTTITLFNTWEPLLDWWRYFISTSSALFFTFSGAWIAIKSKKLSKPS